MAIQYTGGRTGSSSPPPGQAPPTIRWKGVRGTHPQWLLRYWISPLPDDDIQVAVSWTECGVDETSWRLRRALIDEGLQRAVELQAVQDTAVANDAHIEADLQSLGDVAARLTDLGARLHNPRPHTSREPIVRVPRSDGTVEVHPVTDARLPQLTSLLEGQVVHLVTVEGAVNGQAIVFAEDTATIARALAVMPSSRRQERP
ncbi:hypothetical protein E1293_29880 [Actinomadura darangshiensis]|uniref:Uncharacterized protein n=1 Tax=Actinomadura darangshiensis TaxID=705336 RepID=A0A4R5AQU3_9ACTN|nr:hypothetical protein [Actinomadura darangshiensis]TDD74230.1 hypothetical protein E1293_29880 [Actinomadura darangshiensis]